MLPSEYEPLKLTARQQEVHDRYTAMGFKICPRPFAGKGDHLYFFMSLPSPEVPKGIEFTLNLHSGIAHRTGTQTVWELEAAEKEFGDSTGERQGVSPPCEVPAVPVPVAAAEVEPVKPPLEKPVASQAEPVHTHGGLTPSRSPVKKKQPVLF